MVEPRTVHLIDASPYIFRAFFAVPNTLFAPDGSPINAVHGFGAFLLRYIGEQNPTHMGVAFDESLTTSFRNEIYPDYKAQRELPPRDLEAQQQACLDVASALGAATYVSDRYEADDLIGTLCHQLVRDAHSVVVVSSDKDLTQLVGPRVEFMDFARERTYGEREVLDKFGVRPEQVADFLGLAGDSVDNIPGVPGVGPKSAAALLGAFADLDAIYADLPRVAELEVRGARSLAKKLEASRESAMLSRELARLALDAPVRARLADLELRGARAEVVGPLFERLGIHSLASRIQRWEGPPLAP